MTCAPRNEHLGVFIPARRRVEPEAFERSKPIEPKPAGAKAADKRIFWGRGWTYRTLVAISILEHNLGPGWMLMAIRELLGHEATKATMQAVERIARRKAMMREYRKRPEVLARKGNRHKTLKGLGVNIPHQTYDGKATHVGAGTRAQLADAVVLDAHAHLNPDEEIMPVDSEDEDAKSIEVTSESEDESEDEMLTPSPR